MDEYSYINDPPHKRLARFVLFGAVAGAICGLLYLWQFGFLWKELVAAVSAGGIAGLVMGFVAAFHWKRRRGIMISASPIAGALGGAAWWTVVRPETSIVLSAMIGAIILATLFVLAELGFNV